MKTKMFLVCPICRKSKSVMRFWDVPVQIYSMKCCRRWSVRREIIKKIDKSGESSIQKLEWEAVD